MKIIKYEHACLVVEDHDKRLIIDPGNYVKSAITEVDNVVGLVITHVHADHFDPEHIKGIIQKNPSIKIFCTGEVAKQLNIPGTKIVSEGEEAQIGSFRLRFYGKQHAPVHYSWPVDQNVGVLINDRLYYPGDSFTIPDVKVALLALPVSAPWLKLGETMDFLTAVKPSVAFPTHNALLSEVGEQMVDKILGGIAKQNGGTFSPLAVGESIDT